MNTAIVYYSMSGNTAYAAERAAAALQAELIPIEPQKAYPDKGFKRFLFGGKSAIMGEKPPLVPYAFEADKYDRVILASPVWASRPAPPLRTFIEENREGLSGKRISVILCSMGGGYEKAAEAIRALVGAGELEASLGLIEPKNKPSEDNERKLAVFTGKLLG